MGASANTPYSKIPRGRRDKNVIAVALRSPRFAAILIAVYTRTLIGLTCCVLLLSACGGGSSSGTVAPSGWTSGVFQPASNFAAQCANPRVGTDPVTKRAYPDMAGSTLDENNWLRSWTNDLYLWFDEVADQNPSLFSTTASYFAVLKTTAITASGAPKDKFHFTYPTSAWESMSVLGVQAGYGAQWVIVTATPPRQVVVAYTEPGSPAVAPSANLARGAEVLAVDGVDVVNDDTQSGIDIINAGLFPANDGETHSFQIRDQATQAIRDVTLVSANVATQSVQNVGTIATATGPVGYMLFNDQLAPAEAGLRSAFTTLRAAGVRDLILDIRYNGGGYLEIASEAAYMIAGPGPTAGMTFELIQFNSKHPSVDPVTGAVISPQPFLSTTQGFSVPKGQPLPPLDLMRVFVLTGPNTCSASEAIMNGLRGVGIEVIQIGSTTCGKPYGFYPQDNCGTTYFSIQFRGVNAVDFGDYTDGFSPINALTPTSAQLPGCAVADDFTHALGDPAEARVAAALNYRNTSSCPAASAFAPQQGVRSISAVDGRLPASPLRQLRILRH
jgi:carboxyl-terminal processing protease